LLWHIVRILEGLLRWNLLIIVPVLIRFLPIAIVVLRIVWPVMALRVEWLAKLVVLRILRLVRLGVLLKVLVVPEAVGRIWRGMAELLVENRRALVSLVVVLRMQVVIVLLVLLATWRRMPHPLVNAWRE
jgi:hypothetical protein